MEQKVFRQNELDKLKKVLSNYKPENIFLVRGNNSFQTSGAEQFIKDILGCSDINSFYDFSSNPKIEDLKKGIEIFQRKNHDLIIAIGGGSVIDMGKLISVLAHQKADIERIVSGKEKIETPKTKLLAIPTTAGSGAEATRFAVLYINNIKYSVKHTFIQPDFVFLSSKFNLPENTYTAACSGVDAFCQAVESVWSVKANQESEQYALLAAELMWNNLQKAIFEKDEIAREKIQEASFLSGKAINISETTAPHALSYAFTSFYNIPHGHAVALSLPFFMNYNYNINDENCADKRGANHVKEKINKLLKIFNVESIHAQTAIESFFNSVGINIRILTLVDNFDSRVIINNINFDRLNNNPRIISEKTILEFLEDSK